MSPRSGLLPISVMLVGLLLSGCLWRSYEAVLEVHLTVLMQMTDKLCGLGEAGRTPSAADIVEFTYPAQRGRTFLHQFDRYSERASYQDFQAFLDHYEAMVKRVDAARANAAQWQAEQALQQRDRAELTHLAARIRTDLKR